MNQLTHTLLLQNSTFNGWAWAIGTLILLILVGIHWDDGDTKTILMIPISFFWPVIFGFLLIVGIVYIPIWVGRQLAKRG